MASFVLSKKVSVQYKDESITLVRWLPKYREVTVPFDLVDWIFQKLDKIVAQSFVNGDEGIDFETPFDGWILTKSKYFNTVMIAFTYTDPNNEL